MYYMFNSTNDVFECEEILAKNDINFKVVPTPVKEKAYCGVCIWSDADEIVIRDLMKDYIMDVTN